MGPIPRTRKFCHLDEGKTGLSGQSPSPCSWSWIWDASKFSRLGCMCCCKKRAFLVSLVLHLSPKWPNCESGGSICPWAMPAIVFANEGAHKELPHHGLKVKSSSWARVFENLVPSLRCCLKPFDLDSSWLVQTLVLRAEGYNPALL